MKKLLSFIRNSDIFSHLTSLNYLPRWAVLICDIVLCSFSLGIIYFFYLEAGIERESTSFILILERFLAVIILQVFFFWIFHTYSGVLRYSSYIDATKLLLAVVANTISLSLVNLLINATTGILLFHYYTLISYGFLAFFFLFFLRMGVKIIYDFYIQNSEQIVPVMIYGTRSAGIGIAKMIRATQYSKYKLVGFIDEDSHSNKREIMGLRVYNLNRKTMEEVISKKAKAVIVSPLKMQKINPNKDLDIFLNNNISIYTIPLVGIWQGRGEPLERDVLTRRIKSIQIEDLLERPEIKISTEHIAQQVNSKVVLVTGAAGSIGSEIVRQMTRYQPSLIVLMDQAESPIHDLKLELEHDYPEQNISIFLGDVRNQQRMDYMMDLYRPDFIYHAAAYKHVPLMEDNPTEGIQVNVMGTKIMADLAVKYGVKRFVMISSDKAVNPTNVMGASKRIAEIYVQSLFLKNKKQDIQTTKFITTRFGNVLGSNGSVIPHFKRQIEQGGPITVTHPEIIRYFMTIPEACMLVLEAAAMGEGGEIFIFDMGRPVKIADLARKMIRLSGYVPEQDIKIIYTGLRQGEKLYEELLNHKETVRETHNSKIMIASVRKYDYDDVSSEIDELIRYSWLGKDFLVVSQMKKIVPEFISKNSQYEKLDIEKMNA